MKILHVYIAVLFSIGIFLLSCQDENKTIELPPKEDKVPIVPIGLVTDISFFSADISGKVLLEEDLLSQCEYGLFISSTKESLNTDSTNYPIKLFTNDYSYSLQLSELDSATTYFYCNYILYKKKYYYSDTLSFTTKTPKDVIITGTLEADSCSITSKIESNGITYFIDQVGVCYGLNEYPTTSDYFTLADSLDINNCFNVKLSNIPFDTLYNYRAFIRIKDCYYYGTTIKANGNTVITGDIDTLAYTVDTYVKIVDGVTQVGVCYSNSDAPTIRDNKVFSSVLMDNNNYTHPLTNIPFGTVYYRSYVIKDGTVYYGEIKRFEGNSIITGDYDSKTKTITTTIKICSGYDSQEIGICYSMNIEPTINDKKLATSVTESNNIYSIVFSGLPAGTINYRSYMVLYGNIYYGEIKSVYIEPTWVDLGLSVLWATTNIGAANSSEYGNYYSWGETETKNYFSEYSYKWYQNGTWDSRTKYSLYSYMGYNGFVDGKIELDPEDDVAHVSWGGECRIPSCADFDELLNNCTWRWTNQNGFGFKITSKKNGNSIFLPATGERGFNKTSDVSYGGIIGHYWTRDLNMNTLEFDTETQRVLYGDGNYYYGITVRPVKPSKTWINNLSISFKEENVSIPIDGTYQLKTTIKDGNNDANYYEIEWSTNDPTIVSIDCDGIIKGLKLGSTTVIANCMGKTVECTVIVKDPIKEAIDLGLSVKWASCNIGSLYPELFGNYYSFGELEPKKNYAWGTYKWSNDNSNNSLTKYCYDSTSGYCGYTDNKLNLDEEDDVAHVMWGGGWRIPTSDEITELIENCTWVWTTKNNVNGYIITSNKPGFTDHSIFLPACGGYFHSTDYWYDGESGLYRTSTLNTESPQSGSYLTFGSNSYALGSYNRFTDYGSRANGFSIRPVCP